MTRFEYTDWKENRVFSVSNTSTYNGDGVITITIVETIEELEELGISKDDEDYKRIDNLKIGESINSDSYGNSVVITRLA